MSYDVVVIGAGSAGCVLAARLSEERDRKVLLLEAGPDYSTRGELPLDIADGSHLPSDQSLAHDWRLTSTPDPAGGVQPVPLPRGRIVGGSSAVNGTFALRGLPADYDAWGAAGNHGWTYEEVLPWFRRLETDLDHGERPWHGAEGPVPVRRYPPAERSRLAQAFLDAAVTAGHPEVEDHNAPGAVGAGPLPCNTFDRLRMSAALTHLEPARSRPNLTVRGLAPIDRIELDRRRAVGVRLVGGEVVHADRIVLAAGAYASPTVLLRSGIGPADELAALGIVSLVDLPGVGRGLVDHPLLSLNVPVTTEPVARPFYQSMVTWRSDGEDAGDAPPDLHLFACGPFAARSLPDGQDVAALAVGLLDPASRGAVRLVSPDPTEPPQIDPGYLTDPRDLEPLVRGVQQARRILATEPLCSLTTGPELVPGAELSDDAALRTALPELVRTYHHPVGTCRMGPDPDEGAVVDTGGAVHGIEGLWTVDASIMPRIPRANTNLPTLMLAERLAHHLADQHPARVPTTAGATDRPRPARTPSSEH